MNSFGIVPPEMLFNAVAQLLIGVEGVMIQLFIFDAFKEAFCHGIVPAIAFSAHRLSCKLVVTYNICKSMACVLYAPIGMEQKPRQNTSVLPGICPGSHYG